MIRLFCLTSLFFSLNTFSAPPPPYPNGTRQAYVNVIIPQFVRIKAGSFKMGSPEAEPFRYSLAEAQHEVTLTQDFEIQNTEVTQMYWVSLMGYNPSRFKNRELCPKDFMEIKGVPLCANHPVEMVSWNEVQIFFVKLNSANAYDGYLYRLPTEAEWEYAARGGQPTSFSFGNKHEDLRHFGWFDKNSWNQTHIVGTKSPNPYGLYDMHGNIYEMVQDWFNLQYPLAPQVNPQGPDKGAAKVIRGGSWYSISHVARSAARNYTEPSQKAPYQGFRIVRVPFSTM